MRSFRRHLTAAIAVAIVTAGCSSHTTRPASSSVTTTTTNTGTLTTTPRLPAGLTAEQLNAHLGVGEPTGWVPVDEGDARVWVPGDWADVAGRSDVCGIASGAVIVGVVPSTSCDQPTQQRVPPDAVALIPLSGRGPERSATPVHGFWIYDNNAYRLDPGYWNAYYDVPQLGVRIVTHGSLGSRILQTLAPSSRTVALSYADEPTPSKYRTVTEDGVKLSIPARWPVTEPGRYCGLLSPPALQRVHLTGPISCPPLIPSLTTALLDGVMLFSNSDEFGTEQSPPIAVLHHDLTTLTVYTERNTGENEFEILVQRAGSSITHDLVLGLGRDGRVAGGVLASIRATT